jgi:hypothetical protein
MAKYVKGRGTDRVMSEQESKVQLIVNRGNSVELESDGNCSWL